MTKELSKKPHAQKVQEAMEGKTESKHTQGEWRFIAQGDANQYCILSDNNKWVVAIQQNGEMGTEEQIANAKLISSAPQMYQELIKLREDNKKMLEALKEGKELILSMGDYIRAWDEDSTIPHYWNNDKQYLSATEFEKIEQAIQQAEGKKEDSI